MDGADAVAVLLGKAVVAGDGPGKLPRADGARVDQLLLFDGGGQILLHLGVGRFFVLQGLDSVAVGEDDGVDLAVLRGELGLLLPDGLLRGGQILLLGGQLLLLGAELVDGVQQGLHGAVVLAGDGLHELHLGQGGSHVLGAADDLQPAVDAAGGVHGVEPLLELAHGLLEGQLGRGDRLLHGGDLRLKGVDLGLVEVDLRLRGADLFLEGGALLLKGGVGLLQGGDLRLDGVGVGLGVFQLLLQLGQRSGRGRAADGRDGGADRDQRGAEQESSDAADMDHDDASFS